MSNFIKNIFDMDDMVPIERKTTIAKGIFQRKQKPEKFNSEKYILAKIDNTERQSTHTLTLTLKFRCLCFSPKDFSLKIFALIFSFADFYSLKNFP